MKKTIFALLVLTALGISTSLARHQSKTDSARLTDSKSDVSNPNTETKQKSRPSVQDQVQALSRSTLAEIRSERDRVEKQLNDGRWIERANRGELSDPERVQLSHLLSRFHAVIIVEWEKTNATL